MTIPRQEWRAPNLHSFGLVDHCLQGGLLRSAEVPAASGDLVKPPSD